MPPPSMNSIVRLYNETISLAVFQSWFVKTGFLLALGQNTIPYHDCNISDQSKLKKVSKAVVWRKKSGPYMVVGFKWLYVIYKEAN